MPLYVTTFSLLPDTCDFTDTRGPTARAMLTIGSIRRRQAMGNVIVSTGNRTMVNTGMGRPKDAANAVASVGNRFSLDINPGTALRVSFVNCAARGMGMNTSGAIGMVLRRSAGMLSRIIVANFNVTRGGTALANTISTVGSASVRHSTTSATSKTLINGVTNLGAHVRSNHPNTSATLRVHGVNAPLFIVSNIRSSRKRFGGVSFGSVRGVSVLGSTSTTVCNVHTTGNMMIMAAGGKRRGDGGAISIGTCCN